MSNGTTLTTNQIDWLRYNPSMLSSLPIESGAYWAWSAKVRAWLLVNVTISQTSTSRAEIHGVNEALLVKAQYCEFTTWIGPLRKPNESPVDQPRPAAPPKT